MLQADFALKDLSPLHYFLDIEVQKTDQGLCLSQKKYTADLLEQVGMIQCKPVSTPLSLSSKLSEIDGTPLGQENATR
jgi:hypothetical protein